MKSFIRICFSVSVLTLTIWFSPGFADQKECGSCLPSSVSQALKQLCLAVKNDDKAETLMPHATALLNQDNMDDKILVEQGLQEAICCADEMLSQKDITKFHKVILEHIKKTLSDYQDYLLEQEANEEAICRARPYSTPALLLK